MSGVLHGVLSAIAAAVRDAFFKYVTLLLHGDGTNGAQNNTFLDGSTNNFTITRNGNTTQGSFSPFSQTGWSNFFDGNGDSLTLASNAAFAYGTGDFTWECWFYANSNAGYILDHGVNGGTIAFVSSRLVYYNATVGVGSVLYTTGFANNPPLNTWNHIAAVRNGGTTYLYFNGVLSTSAADSHNYAAQAVYIGQYGGGSNNFPGYISNLRIVNGTAVYTANFTPPTSPLTAITNTSLLTCQSNRFIDNSSNAFAITRNGDVRVEAFSPFNPSTTYSTANVGGSGYFDGTGDYLIAPTNAAFDFGSGNFTVELWFYTLIANSNYQRIFGINVGGPIPTESIVFEIDTAGVKLAAFNGTTGYGLTTATPLATNTWHHLALVRNGNTVTGYINGVSAGSSTMTVAVNFGTGAFPQIGAWQQSGSYSRFINGYLSNLRIVKGTAVYTAAFTPPTAPLTAIANTSLLLNFTNGGIFDNASQTVLETVGNAQISTAQSKFGGGSMYFDGTGDWLTAPDQPAQRFGTADFTVEGWLYLGATGAARGLISKGTATTGWSVNVTSGNKLQFSYTASNLTGVTSLSASTWYYFTAMRTGGSIRVYLNGTQEVTNSTAITDNFNQTNILYVGADRVGGSALNGYIDDLRVTNGYARYNNFTPSTTALTPTAYTTVLPNTSTTNGAQNNTFLDGSTNNFTITRNGNTTQGTFSPFSNSGWSNSVPNTAYITIPGGVGFQFGTGDFTIEMFVWIDSSISNPAIIASTGSGFSLFYSSGLLYYQSVTGSPSVISNAGGPDRNQWAHIAIARSGTTTRLFVNGVLFGSGTDNNNYTDSSSYRLGNRTYNNAFYSGLFSNVRIVKGTALYTAAFTPPTSPLTDISGTSVLTCQSNRFIDTSSNNLTITPTSATILAFDPFTPAAYSSSTNGGSGYFDGTGDYLASTSTITLGTNAFTIEFWVYANSIGAATMFVAGTTTNSFQMVASGANLAFGTYNVANVLSTTTSPFVVNQWLHIVYVRSGTGTNQASIFVNGVRAVNGTVSTNYVAGAITVGGFSGGQNVTGYMSDVRVVNGTAVYDPSLTTLTVPTAPLTAIANTSLLCNFTNAGIYDAVGINNYETVGNAQASTTQTKFGTTSMYFDGTGDWITAPDNFMQRLGASNFTIEGWFYLSAINTAYGIVSKGTSTTGWSVNITSGNKLQFSYTSSNLTGATTLAASTWYHFAVVRSGGTVQIYLNGVQDAISSSAITTDFNQTNILYIGANRTGGDAMNGYLDDIRITPVQALYPGNFTPPTAPFPNN